MNGNHVNGLPSDFDKLCDRPYLHEILTCNYCGKKFDSEQLEPTYYLKKFTGLACPECLTELNNFKK